MKKNILLAALILTPTLALADNNEMLVVDFKITDGMNNVIDTFKNIAITKEGSSVEASERKEYLTSVVEDVISKQEVNDESALNPPLITKSKITLIKTEITTGSTLAAALIDNGNNHISVDYQYSPAPKVSKVNIPKYNMDIDFIGPQQHSRIMFDWKLDDNKETCATTKFNDSDISICMTKKHFQ